MSINTIEREKWEQGERMKKIRGDVLQKKKEMQNRENREKEIHVSKRKRGERDKEKGGGRMFLLRS